jgi:hypothetical protein
MNIDYKNSINVINKEKLKDLLVEMTKYKKAIIFGKGPSLFYIDKEENEDKFFICINNTINFIKKCDLLVCNDIESFENIDFENLKYCKNILVPYHIHINHRYSDNVTYKTVIQKIAPYFSGNLIVYNLNNAKKKYNEFISFDYHTKTSVHTGFAFISAYFKNIETVDFYGFAKKIKNIDEREINLYPEEKLENHHFKNYKGYIKDINILNNKFRKGNLISYRLN